MERNGISGGRFNILGYQKRFDGKFVCARLPPLVVLLSSSLLLDFGIVKMNEFELNNLRRSRFVLLALKPEVFLTAPAYTTTSSG